MTSPNNLEYAIVPLENEARYKLLHLMLSRISLSLPELDSDACVRAASQIVAGFESLTSAVESNFIDGFDGILTYNGYSVRVFHPSTAGPEQ